MFLETAPFTNKTAGACKRSNLSILGATNSQGKLNDSRVTFQLMTYPTPNEAGVQPAENKIVIKRIYHRNVA